MITSATRHGPFPGQLEPQRISAYAAATGDETAAVVAGMVVPATFPVILVFDAQEAANGDLPATAWRQAHGGVHGEHDVVLHRPLIPGESLETWSQLSAVRTTRAGTQVVLHIDQFDSHGRLAVEHWWTTMLLGLQAMADLGSMPGDHRFPDAARNKPIGSSALHVDSRWPAATPRCPATGRHITSISTRRGRPASTSCSPTACAPWQCAPIGF